MVSLLFIRSYIKFSSNTVKQQQTFLLTAPIASFNKPPQCLTELVTKTWAVNPLQSYSAYSFSSYSYFPSSVCLIRSTAAFCLLRIQTRKEQEKKKSENLCVYGFFFLSCSFETWNMKHEDPWGLLPRIQVYHKMWWLGYLCVLINNGFVDSKVKW